MVAKNQVLAFQLSTEDQDFYSVAKSKIQNIQIGTEIAAFFCVTQNHGYFWWPKTSCYIFVWGGVFFVFWVFFFSSIHLPYHFLHLALDLVVIKNRVEA